MTSALASALHLLGLALAVAMMVLRDRAFSSRPFDPAARDRLLAADNLYGLASMMLVGANRVSRPLPGSASASARLRWWLQYGKSACSASVCT